MITNGLGGRITKILIDLYSKTKSYIKIDNILSGAINETFGVNQGGVMSPFLFTEFLKDLGDHLGKSGVFITETDILNYLLWADDLFLISSTPEGLQKLLNNLYDYCKKWHLIVNTMKTKIMIYTHKRNESHDFYFNGQKVDNVEDYNYLGCLFHHKPSKSKKFQIDAMLDSARKALFKVYKYLKPFGQRLPTVACHLFDTLVKPVIEYGSEVWSPGTNLNEIDLFERKFLKNILGVREQTINIAVYGEFGRIPISYKIKEKAIKYFLRIHSNPVSPIISQAMESSKNLHKLGYSTWYGQVLNLIEEIKLQHLINPESPTKLSPKVKKLIKTSLFDQYKTIWTSANTVGHTKVEMYKSFKVELKPEPYLHLPHKNYRIMIARFRTSSHHLAIETGRHTKPLTPKNLRLCNFCQKGDIEDEHHALLVCDAYSIQRQNLLECMCKAIPNFNEYDSKEQLRLIICNDNSEVLTQLGKFLAEMQKVRTQLEA